VKEFLKELFKKFNEQNLNYCVLRGYETLPQEIENDIDFGVSKDDALIFEDILTSISKKYGYIFFYKKEIYGFKQFYIINKNNYAQYVHIDIWTKLAYKGMEYIELDVMLNNCTMYNNLIRVPLSGHECALSFLKEFFHNGWIREDKAKILKSKYDNDFDLLLNRHFSKNKIDSFKKFIKNETKNLNKQSMFSKSKLVINNIKTKGSLTTIKNICLYLSYFIKNLFTGSGGLFVVLIGPDGSGKTTMSDKIIDNLGKFFFNKSIYRHGRFEYLPRLSEIFKFRKKDNNIKSDNIVEPIDSKYKYSSSKAMVYMIYYLLDYIFGYLFILKYKAQNKIILFDRYYYDYMIQSTFENSPKLLKWIYKTMAPKPDLLIFLKAKPEMIYARKPELNIEEITKQQEKIQQVMIENFLYKKFIEVDSVSGIDQAYKHVENEIFKLKVNK
jgi:thymidylate kinase